MDYPATRASRSPNNTILKAIFHNSISQQPYLFEAIFLLIYLFKEIEQFNLIPINSINYCTILPYNCNRESSYSYRNPIAKASLRTRLRQDPQYPWIYYNPLRKLRIWIKIQYLQSAICGLRNLIDIYWIFVDIQ